MADTGTTENGEIFELSAADGRAVAGDEEQLGLAISHGAESVLVTYIIWQEKIKMSAHH